MKSISRFTMLSLTAILAIGALAQAADTYTVDPVHSSAVFRVHHANVGYVWGRFNDPSGSFSIDESDLTKSTFSVEIAVANVDTHNEKRDAHLKSPDFFNAKQYPTITFKSTAVKKSPNTSVQEGNRNVLDVTGDLTIHGVTKSVTVPVEYVGKGQFPPGTPRAGIEATFNLKMSDFKFKGMPGMIGDEVRVIVAMEGTAG